MRLVRFTSMFIQRATAAIFACTFMKIIFTSAVTANRTITALIRTIEKLSISKITPSVFFKDISCFIRVSKGVPKVKSARFKINAATLFLLCYSRKSSYDNIFGTVKQVRIWFQQYIIFRVPVF